MTPTTLRILGLAVVWAAFLSGSPVSAEQHRATRLGNPATRFAPPLVTPDDLRARFRDPALKPDIASILRQWGWRGNLEDLHHAVLTNEITEVKIPVGATMPFMSSRENGRPVCLRNVLWAGQEPISAFAFSFSSKGQRYRCVTPKPCSNFFLEDLGPEPRAGLALECRAPVQVLAGRPVEVCLTVRNTGNIPDTLITVTLPIPDGVVVVRTTEGGAVAAGSVTWEVANLTPSASRQLCAVLAMRQPGVLSFQPTATSPTASLIRSACATEIAGVPAILLEVVDLEDPIEVGGEVIYDIKVTNQGSAPATNVRVVCIPAGSQVFASATGVTPVQAQDGMVTAAVLPVLAPKAAATWRVVVKAAKPDDARFKVVLSSDQFKSPIQEDESTQQY